MAGSSSTSVEGSVPRTVPSLSVIVPTRDTRALTLACLHSLAAGAPPHDVEILVVDDASRDGTAEAIHRSFPAVRLLRNREGAGFTISVNRALMEARGEVLLLLNSDTEVVRGSLQALTDALSDPRLGVVGAQLSYPDGRTQWSGGREPSLVWLFLLSSGFATLLSGLGPYRRVRQLLRFPSPRLMNGVDWVTGAALAVRRKVLDQIGLLDERFEFYAQDLDLCLRAGDAGWAVAVAPEFRVVHHHGSSITQEQSTVEGQQLGLLWTDLLRWAKKRHGESWSRRAWHVLRLGVKMRIAARRVLDPTVRSHRRAAWASRTRAVQQALGTLESFGADHLRP